MKILHISKYYPPYIGGIESHVKTLATEQSKCYQVSVLAYNSTRKTMVEMEDKIRVVRLGSWGSVRSVPLCIGFFHWLNELSDVDIIHLHSPNPVAEFALSKLRLRAKLVITYHTDVVRQRLLYNLYKPVQDSIFKRADALVVIAPNMFDCSPTLQRFRDKCHIIPHGIDLSIFAPVAPKKCNMDILPQGRIVMYAGRLVPFKGVDVLIRAMQFVQEEAQLLIVGSGPCESRLRKMAACGPARGRIHFLGGKEQSSLPGLYQAAEVFVLPSISCSESFGLVMLEAMACGTPLVSSDIPTGVTYVNKHRINGLVVPPRDPTALGETVNYLLERPELCRKLGENGRRRVWSEFSHTVMAEKIHKLYESLDY